MSDLASLVLGVPGYVEGFVKLGRTIQKLQSLEKDHIEIVEDAMFCAETLEYYAGFLDVNDPDILCHPSLPLLEEALIHAYDALDRAQSMLNDWKLRLDPDVRPRGKVMIDKFANWFAEKTVRFSLGGRNPKPVRVRFSTNLLAKATYLAFGSVEIKDAMERLNKWVTRFGQLLLTSPNLRLRRDGSSGGNMPTDLADDVAFVARARERLKGEREVPIVAIEHLSSAFGIDPDHKCGILRLEDGDFAGYIVDTRDLCLRRSDIAFEAERSDTIRICRLFSERPSDTEIGARASVGILPCAGYAIRESPPIHYLLFRLPSGTGSPRTLRSLLLSGTARHSLNSRLDFCTKLATSVLIAHSLGLVHKNVRPDSILVIKDLRSDHIQDELGIPYLISFGQARLASGHSGKQPYRGEIYARTLYVHPRHMSGKRMKWQMRDDIYSLGICLFEVAIWRSLLRWDSEEGGLVGDFDLLPISDSHYDKILQNRGGISIHHDRIWMRRSDIIKYANEMIPATMGGTFRDIVVKCLHFGDKKIWSDDVLRDDTGDEDYNGDKANLQSVMFVEDILTKLRKLVFAF